MRTLFGLLFLIALFFFGAHWYLTEGFSLRHIKDPLPYERRWATDPPLPLVKESVQQPFTYIGKGSQCYVFLSEDGNYVLKFLRLDRYLPRTLDTLLPFPTFLRALREAAQEEREGKREALFTSCLLAYRELREETGLLYLHLNKTEGLLPSVTLYDKIKGTHTVDLDQHAFLIQKKGERVYVYLARLLREGHFEEAHHALLQLAALLEQRKEKEIGDRDTALHKNSGFAQGKPFFFDVGQFYRTKRDHSFPRESEKLVRWLEKQDPRIGEEARKLFACGAQESALYKNQ